MIFSMTSLLKPPLVPSKIPERAAPEAFFHEAYQAFMEAEKRAGAENEHYFRIGRHVLHLRFAGGRMVPFITPALEHLRTEPVEVPSLTVCVWDNDSTGIRMGPPPWSREDFVFRGEIRGYNTERIRTAY